MEQIPAAVGPGEEKIDFESEQTTPAPINEGVSLRKSKREIMVPTRYGEYFCHSVQENLRVSDSIKEPVLKVTGPPVLKATGEKPRRGKGEALPAPTPPTDPATSCQDLAMNLYLNNSSLGSPSNLDSDALLSESDSEPAANQPAIVVGQPALPQPAVATAETFPNQQWAEESKPLYFKDEPRSKSRSVAAPTRVLPPLLKYDERQLQRDEEAIIAEKIAAEEKACCWKEKARRLHYGENIDWKIYHDNGLVIPPVKLMGRSMCRTLVYLLCQHLYINICIHIIVCIMLYTQLNRSVYCLYYQL